MTDLVKKYQHYFNESVKLQETVNEQLAYITELEDAIIALDEAYRMTPERDAILKREKNKAQRVIDDIMGYTSDTSELTDSEHVLVGQAFDRNHRIYKIRNKTVKEEVLELDETSKELKLRYILKASGADPANPSKTRSGMGNNIPTAIRGLEDAAASRDEGDREYYQKMYDKRRSGIRAAIRALGKQQDTVQEATWMGQRASTDDEPGTVARVGRITKFLEKYPDPSKMKAHHLNTFFEHPDYFGETDAASAAAMRKLPVQHRKTIRAMRKDNDDREW